METYSPRHSWFGKILLPVLLIFGLTFCTPQDEVPVTINISTSTPRPVEVPQTEEPGPQDPTVPEPTATPYPALDFTVLEEWKCNDNKEREIILSVNPTGGEPDYTISPDSKFRARPGDPVTITVNSEDGQSKSMTLLVPYPPMTLVCYGGEKDDDTEDDDDDEDTTIPALCPTKEKNGEPDCPSPTKVK